MQIQTMAEALAVLWAVDPQAAEATVDYLADLGRLEAVVGKGLVLS